MKTFTASVLLLAVVASFNATASTTSPAKYKYHDLANGQRIVVPVSSPLPSTGQQIWNAATSATNNSLPLVGQSSSLPNPSGGLVPVTAKGTLPALEVGKAVGRAALKIGSSLAFVGTGLALYDLAKELGFNLARNSDGSLSVAQATPSGACDLTGGGISYSTGAGNTTPWPTFLAQAAPDSRYQCVQSFPQNESTCSPTVQCKFVGSSTIEYAPLTWATKALLTNPVTEPSTIQDLQNAVSSKPAWPAASKINDVMLDDPSPQLQVPTQITTSGPASSPGPVSTTVNTTNNTTRTDTTTHNYSYAGDTITTTNNFTSVTIDNSTGAITNSTTSVSTPPAPAPTAPEPDFSSIDSALPSVPKLYEPVYPKGFSGVWAEKKDQLKSAPLTSLATSLMPNVASSGACPSMPVDLTFASWASFGVRDVAPPCYVWDWAKAFVILGALLLARALIFGG